MTGKKSPKKPSSPATLQKRKAEEPKRLKQQEEGNRELESV